MKVLEFCLDLAFKTTCFVKRNRQFHLFRVGVLDKKEVLKRRRRLFLSFGNQQNGYCAKEKIRHPDAEYDG